MATRSRAILLSMPRTGSTMITRQLSRHPEVAFVGAIFSIEGWAGDGPGRQAIKRTLGPEWNDLAYRVAHHRQLLDHVFGAYHASCVGLKHHLSGDASVTETVLADPSIAKILLTRDNVLACYSSDKMVAVKKAQDEGGLPADAKARFEPDEFAGYVRRREKIYARWLPLIDAAAGAVTRIDYATARVPGGIDRLLDFLGLPPAPTQPITAKRNSDDVVSRFANPEDVRAHLAENGQDDWAEERPAG